MLANFLHNAYHDYDAAEPHLRHAVALAPLHVEARYLLAWTFAYQNRNDDEAERALRLAVELDPKNPLRKSLERRIRRRPTGTTKRRQATGTTAADKKPTTVPWSAGLALAATIIAGLAGVAYLRHKKKHAEIAAWVDKELGPPPRRVTKKKAEPRAARRRKT